MKAGEFMSTYNQYFIKMQDGTIKQINPFTGTEVWTVPGRASKPITNSVPETAKKIRKKEKRGLLQFLPGKISEHARLKRKGW